MIADDEEVDTLEVQIDREGVNIMLRFHPLASDMRNVISTMKLSVNLERIADQAVGIARRSRKLIMRPPAEQAPRSRADLSVCGDDGERLPCARLPVRTWSWLADSRSAIVNSIR